MRRLSHPTHPPQTTGRWLILLTPTASLPSPATAALARAARAAPGTHAAAVDTTASPSTASRFGDGPAIILLADRQLYRFDGDASSPDNDALAAFASDPEAAGVSGEPVPPPASADPVAAALAVIKSVWADVQARAVDAGIDAESIKSKLASAGLDADALASRATAALDAAPGGAQGVAAAGLGGVALLAVAVARAGGRRAAGVAASPGIARPTRAAAKKRA